MLASRKETRDSGVLHTKERRVKMIFLWRQVEGERVTCPKSTQDMGKSVSIGLRCQPSSTPAVLFRISTLIPCAAASSFAKWGKLEEPVS